MQPLFELNTKIANDSLAALKQLGEINLKAVESLVDQQKGMYDDFTAKAQTTMKKLKAVKDQKEFLDLQNALFQEGVTSVLGNWKKTTAVANSTRDAYRELAEATMQIAQGNVEKATETVKEASEAVTKTVTKAVIPAAKKAA